MNRRTFILDSCKACAFAGAGLILGSSLLQSCASLGLAVIKTEAVGGQIRLPLVDFADHKIKLVRVAGQEYDIAIRKTAGDRYLALLLKCTHAGQPLTKAGDGFYCTLHGSQFAADGTVEKGPAAQALIHLPVTIQNDQLIVQLAS